MARERPDHEFVDGATCRTAARRCSGRVAGYGIGVCAHCGRCWWCTDNGCPTRPRGKAGQEGMAGEEATATVEALGGTGRQTASSSVPSVLEPGGPVDSARVWGRRERLHGHRAPALIFRRAA